MRDDVRMQEDRDREGRTDLHYAALENDTQRIRELVDRGADASAADISGMTPLHFAAQQTAVDAVELLIAAGADVNAVDGHGNGPLWTATFNSRGETRLVEMLCRAGADPHHANNTGRSPMDLARTMGVESDLFPHFI